MIKSNGTLRGDFAKHSPKKIGTGNCSTKPVVGIMVLDNYKDLANGKTTTEQTKNNDKSMLFFNAIQGRVNN